MKLPEECRNIQEIRECLDTIDQQIISTLAQRFSYVQAAAKFKNNPQDVQAADRVETMLKQRRIWAEDRGINPDVIEKIYRDLVNYFIDEELQSWLSKNS
ncbi:chorismate mutase [Calothrix sp. 336/3]|uniref:chorismate mutase n=1 Tax=Calothrix sp. 336/3 TaxID=1337936 RepID=UPI0004E384B2|nr:chorismate mutase [Calothrix sp. 336/3]